MTEHKWKTRSWVVIDFDQVWADDIVCTAPDNEAANLIASAPDLYEALERMVQDVPFGDEPEFALKALAKARGKQVPTHS